MQIQTNSAGIKPNALPRVEQDGVDDLFGQVIGMIGDLPLDQPKVAVRAIPQGEQEPGDDVPLSQDFVQPGQSGTPALRANGHKGPDGAIADVLDRTSLPAPENQAGRLEGAVVGHEIFLRPFALRESTVSVADAFDGPAVLPGTVEAEHLRQGKAFADLSAGERVDQAKSGHSLRTPIAGSEDSAPDIALLAQNAPPVPRGDGSLLAAFLLHAQESQPATSAGLQVQYRPQAGPDGAVVQGVVAVSAGLIALSEGDDPVLAAPPAIVADSLGTIANAEVRTVPVRVAGAVAADTQAGAISMTIPRALAMGLVSMSGADSALAVEMPVTGDTPLLADRSAAQIVDRQALPVTSETAVARPLVRAVEDANGIVPILPKGLAPLPENADIPLKSGDFTKVAVAPDRQPALSEAVIGRGFEMRAIAGVETLPTPESGSADRGAPFAGAVSNLPTAPTQPPVSAAISPLHPPVAQQVAQVVTTALRQGKTGQIDVLLRPKELGQIRFEMTVVGEKIHVIVSAERPEAMDMIRRNVDQLMADLRQSGFGQATFGLGGWTAQDQAEKPTPKGERAAEDAPADDFSSPNPHRTPQSYAGQGRLDLRL